MLTFLLLAPKIQPTTCEEERNRKKPEVKLREKNRGKQEDNCFSFNMGNAKSNAVSFNSVTDGDAQEEVIEMMRLKCAEKLFEKRKESEERVLPQGQQYEEGCQGVWDGIMCWEDAAAGETVKLPCPEYIMGFDVTGEASRRCMENGEWSTHPEERNFTWTNYSMCLLINSQTNGSVLAEWLPMVKSIARVGYSVSFITIVAAFIIMVSIKKLRCPRNILHMHLFVSFMMRAFMVLLKDILLDQGLSFDLITHKGEFSEDKGWVCKLVISLWQFFIMANYFWVLMEGLYLHNLIFMALFTDSSSIMLYIILGWGLPALVVVPWICLRAALENTHCWTTNENTLLFLVIRIPIAISILVNFVLFVNIVRVLLLKLQSSVSEESRKFRRWAKSTLVLVPLFGVHYFILIGMSYSIGINEVMEIIWLVCDQFFASFQGCFVAILYCFMNGEVRAELSKIWLHRCKKSRNKNGRMQWWLSSGYADESSRRTSKGGFSGTLVIFTRRFRDKGDMNRKISQESHLMEATDHTKRKSKPIILEESLQPAWTTRPLQEEQHTALEAELTAKGRSMRGCWSINKKKCSRAMDSQVRKSEVGSAMKRLKLRLGMKHDLSPQAVYSCQTMQCTLDSTVAGSWHARVEGDRSLPFVYEEQDPSTSPLLEQPSKCSERESDLVKSCSL